MESIKTELALARSELPKIKDKVNIYIIFPLQNF